MTDTEIIIAVLALVSIVGQWAFITWARNRTFFKDRQNARKRADLIEREFDKQNGESK